MRGVRVLDLSVGRAGAYCGRLLASVGADVVVGEPPEGSPLRRLGVVPDRNGRDVSVAWEYLRANTSSVVVNGEASLAELADGFDVVVLDEQGDLTTVIDEISAARLAHPNLVVAVITPYGLTGPKSSWRAGPLEHWALGGHMSLNGEPDRHPLPGGGPWVTHLVGATAAVGIQAALVNAASTGTGDLVEVSALEALANCHQWSFTLYTHNGVTKQRWGNRMGEQHHPLALYECLDGWICIASVSMHQWDGICIAIGQPELLARDDLYVPAVRFDHADELDELISAWTAGFTVADAVAILQEHQVPAGPVASLNDMLESPQLVARGYWMNLDNDAPSAELEPVGRVPGPPFRIDHLTPVHRRAPEIGNAHAAVDGESGAALSPVGRLPSSRYRAGHAGSAYRGASTVVDGHVNAVAEIATRKDRWPSRSKPLAGVRVVEFTVAWAGPLVGRMLGDLGADVVKVEHPTGRGLAMPRPEMMATERGDWEWGQMPGPLSRNGIFLDNDPGEDWYNRLGYWNKMNRSKRSLCLDVKAPGGREVLHRLVATADVVVNNYSPRGVRSVGITPAEMQAVNPGIVTLDMSGFGATGPHAERISWGPVLDAASGLASTTGYPDSGPYKQGIAFPDVVGGLHGTVAALAALWQHWHTDDPVAVDFSQLETAVAVAGEQFLEASLLPASPPMRRGARLADAAPAGVYSCGGIDEWLVLSVPDDDTWASLATILGAELCNPRWTRVPARHADHDVIDELIARWAADRDKHDAAAELQAAGIPASAVMTTADIINDPQSAARKLMVDNARPGEPPQLFPGLQFRFDCTPTALAPTSTLGQHNEPILEELGYTLAAIAALYESDTIATTPPG